MESLGTDGKEQAPEQLASALRSLAAALEILPGATWARVEKIRDAARKLASEDALEAGRMRMVEDGLGAVARVLVDVDHPARAAAFQDAVASLGEALDGLDPDAPVEGRQRSVLRAFRAAADAVLLASGRERRFSEPRSPLEAGSPDSFSDHVVAATAAVEKLAGTDSLGGRRAASDALSALADALESAPDKPGVIAALVAEIRFEAERLRRADPLSFGDTRWIQLGLAAALDSMEALPSGSAPDMKPWLAAARRATQAIKSGRSLSFQRAAVQDAFRTVVDAFTATARRCQCPQRPAR